MTSDNSRPLSGAVLYLYHDERVAEIATWQGEETQGRSLLVQQQGTKKLSLKSNSLSYKRSPEVGISGF